jgi:hypothetical protein
MRTDVDMTYRFVWDSEPTDEQLLVIMQEVGEEVRQSSEKMAKQVIENLEREYALALSQRQIQPE